MVVAIKNPILNFFIKSILISENVIVSDNDYMLNFLASIYKVTYNKLFIL